MRISDWSSDVCSSDLPAMAKKLLKEAGYKGEKVRFMPLPYGETWQRWGEAVRQNLQDVGINLEIVATEDRKSVVKGKSVSVREDRGGHRIIKKKTRQTLMNISACQKHNKQHTK